jgi:hypothetical protein
MLLDRELLPRQPPIEWPRHRENIRECEGEKQSRRSIRDIRRPSNKSSLVIRRRRSANLGHKPRFFFS